VVQPEQLWVVRGLLDDDLDVLQTLAEIVRQMLNRVSDKPLELDGVAAPCADGRAPRRTDSFANDFGRSP